MQILVLPSAPRAAAVVAGFIARTLRHAPDVVLGLPTGRTMIPVYEELVRLHQRGRADFKRATTFNLDEFWGVQSSDPGSFCSFMRRHLFDRVNLSKTSAHFPAGDQPLAYDESIERAGGLDLCLVGLGLNGHLGFNEPADALVARTHRVRLLPATRGANAYLFGGRAGDVPPFAVSMGIGTILRSRAVLLLVTGSDKARVVRKAIAGPVTTRVPASLLQAHSNVVIVLDRRAAAQLRRPR
jgi:glucosamine-6-phosphate deaminase